MGSEHDLTRIGAALRLLRDRGFTDLPRKGATRRFEGPLPYARGSVRIRLEIDDWDFVEYPRIVLLEAPEDTPALLPHINAIGGFCYLAAGLAILDRYHPDHALAQCLDKAAEELNRLATDPQYRQGEFQSEFGASWNIGQIPMPWPILLGSIESQGRQVQGWLVGDAGQRSLAIGSKAEEIEGLCRARGWPAPATSASTCWIVRSDAMPTLPKTGLPRHLGEMFSWIRSWDRHAYGEIQRVLGERAYLAEPNLIVLLHTPAGWFGFMLELDEVKRKYYRRKPTFMRQSLHRQADTLAIQRLAAEEISSDFVHSRNLTYPSLKNRKITVIGCGAIGGYLVQALAKLGAGTGSGELVIVDPDLLGAENLGRHLLGFESFQLPKAQALNQLLQHQFPSSRVTAHPRSAYPLADLKGDLVIDATGEEAFSEAINFQRLSLPEDIRPPLLHVWLLGNGQCIQSLWQDTAKFACFRCLRRNDGTRAPRFEVLREQDQVKILGCHAFTPYAVSAPMSAAALAVDSIIDWLKSGAPSPRFRTRYAENHTSRRVKSQDLQPLAGCPACQAQS